MLDSQIIELYFARDESAIVRTDEKYGRYCRAVAGRILSDRKDAEECVNDAYVGVWNAIPPKRPRNFKLFVGIITRNIALDRFDYNRAKKRGDGAEAAIDEFASTMSDGGMPCDDVLALREIINDFLASLDSRTRIIFMRRYWYMCTVEEIAAGFKLTSANVRVILHRTRRRFAARLKKEGLMR